MLFPSELIRTLWGNDEFKVMIITGDHGYGKSSYANQIISEVYSPDDINRNWRLELFKEHIGFHPMNITLKWLNMKKRDYCFHWDDAGLWLNAMDYQDPFVIAVGKYLQVARTDWAGLIFTCIDRDDIFAKLRNLRRAVVVEIIKHSDKQHPHRRTAIAYEFWKSRSGTQKGTNNLWEEDFNCYMPGNFNPNNPDRIKQPSDKQKKNNFFSWGFYGWYKPLRLKYAYMAKQQMRTFLLKRHKDSLPYAKDLEI